MLLVVISPSRPCTNLLTCYFLGDRSMKTFDMFVFPDLSAAVLVHDRYQNYDAIPGVLHQLCTQHLLRDLEDATQSYPDAVWPGQAAEALRALIHAANTARAKGLARVPDADIAADLRLFRHAVRVGLSEVRRVPGANSKQKPGRTLLECLRDREDDVLRFLTDLRIPPTSDLASYCTSCGGWRVRGLAGRSGRCGAGGFSIAGGSDIFPRCAGAPGFAVGVAAA